MSSRLKPHHKHKLPWKKTTTPMTTEKTDHLEATTLPRHRLPFQISHCQWFRLGRISAVRACRWVGGGGSWFGFDPCGPSRPARGGGFLWRSPSPMESHPDKETSDTWHTFQSFFFKWFKTVSVSFKWCLVSSELAGSPHSFNLIRVKKQVINWWNRDAI